MSFEFKKTPHISLNCKQVPLLNHWEKTLYKCILLLLLLLLSLLLLLLKYENGLLNVKIKFVIVEVVKCKKELNHHNLPCI